MSIALDWDTAEEVAGGGGGDDLFYILQDGLNVFRVVSNPFQFEVHFHKKKGAEKIKRFISPKEGDPLKAMGETPSKRIGFKVLPDNEGKGLTPLDERLVKVLEVGPGIFNDIIKLAKDPDYGHPTNYDLKVTKSGTGKEGTKYAVLARPVEKCEVLTDEIKEKVAEKDIDLAKIYKESTVAEMNEYLNGGDTKNSTTTKKSTSKHTTSVQELDSLDENEDIFGSDS